MAPGSSVSVLKSLHSTEVSFLKLLTCLEGFHLLGVSRASFKDSKRTCLVPDCTQLWIPCPKCYLLVSRNLCINLKSLNCLEGFRLLGVSRAASKESKRTCLVPDCSQLWIPCHKCCLLVSRKLCINFEVSNLPRRIVSPRCLQSVLQGV